MPALGPVGAEDRLTLVEHLGELRTRLFLSIAIVAVAFAFTYWQNGLVLDIVNRPLDRAQVADSGCDKKVDPIAAGGCFDQAVAQALKKLDPLIEDLARDASPAQARQAREAAEAVGYASRIVPEARDRKPVTLGVAEPFFQTINVALYAAIVIALPFLLYQLYAFLIPAFTRRERQAIIPLLIGVPFLFYAGVALGYFFALPRAVDFLQNFNADQFDILVQARDYYKFVLMFLLGTGVVFQVPVLVIGLARLGVLTPKQMRKQRGLVALGSAVIAAIITPTPDAVTMLMLMVPLIVLFEVSLIAADLIERRSPRTGRPSRWDVAEDEDEELVPVAPRGRRDDEGEGGEGHGGAPLRPDDPGPAPPDGGWDDPTPSPPDGGWDDQELSPDWATGEHPDPDLLGDPQGPQVVDELVPETDDSAPLAEAGTEPESDADWRTRADALDAEDPFADPTDGHRLDGPPYENGDRG